MSINAGGVCDNCGEPRFAHATESCPTEADVAAMSDRLNRWHCTVAKVRGEYQRARVAAKKLGNRVRAGKRTPAELAAAQTETDRLWGEYQAAIRRADREA